MFGNGGGGYGNGGGEYIICEFCAEQFESKNKLKKHKKDVHSVTAAGGYGGGGAYSSSAQGGRCDICNEQFEYQYELQEHKRSNHPFEKPWQPPLPWQPSLNVSFNPNATEASVFQEWDTDDLDEYAENKAKFAQRGNIQDDYWRGKGVTSAGGAEIESRIDDENSQIYDEKGNPVSIIIPYNDEPYPEFTVPEYQPGDNLERKGKFKEKPNSKFGNKSTR